MLIVTMVLIGLSAAVPSKMASTRIVGGSVVRNRSKFAYQALILYDGFPNCGGTIIDERHVLTAGHCAAWGTEPMWSSYLTVVVGNLNISDKSIVKEVSNVFVHEGFNTAPIINDIAVLRISDTFEWTDNVKPINLTTNFTYNGTCIVSGFGVTENSKGASEQLRFAELPVVEWKTCLNELCGLHNLSSTQICAGSYGVDSCSGDSGGPLVCSGTLAGIVSAGIVGCTGQFPGIYTEVAKYITWIDQQRAFSPNNVSSSLLVHLLLLAVKFIGY